MAQFTKSTTDAGFQLMTENADAFRKVLGDRPYTVALMNSIYKGEIEPCVNTQGHPDWSAIADKVKPYGTPGNEILLRTETVYYLNNQDWNNYVPKTKEYIQFDGANRREIERRRFEENIREHASPAN
ncbi:hypothetical protein [Puia dinghuensis]|uniref:Uncharacterized protein n=1 Tax=Puia dinghuensis TaxID=1792502 RepID=A0A8J2XX64_9BACT|nr:hypothetical protein [Puia dinghuensis]GGB24068.1 hypothetical protein GCM10011511_54970 [Puia dinghuensis]